MSRNEVAYTAIQPITNLACREKMKRTTLALIFTAVLCWAGSDAGFTAEVVLSGRVERVLDGDSMVVRQGDRRYEIRLWGVDCPEYGQPYGAEARRESTGLLAGKSVQVEVKTRDSYGRYVGVMHLGGMNVNEQLIRRGAAWVYSRYCRERICTAWQELEAQARDRRVGLWAREHPIQPWRWRQKKKS